jgi:hypothetical protein
MVASKQITRQAQSSPTRDSRSARQFSHNASSFTQMVHVICMRKENCIGEGSSDIIWRDVQARKISSDLLGEKASKTSIVRLKYVDEQESHVAFKEVVANGSETAVLLLVTFLVGKALLMTISLGSLLLQRRIAPAGQWKECLDHVDLMTREQTIPEQSDIDNLKIRFPSHVRHLQR